jgi:hypothetical protein
MFEDILIIDNLFIIIVAINVFLLQKAFFTSYKKLSTIEITAFKHLQLSWFLLSLFWLGLIIVDFIKPLNQFSILVLLNIITLLASPVMLELFYFYLNLFSNRLNILETYMPPLIGLTIGISLSALISGNELLYYIPILLVPIISIIFTIYFILIFLRLDKLKNSFRDVIEEQKFIQNIKSLLYITIVASAYDIFWFPMAMIFNDSFYLILSFGFLVLIAVIFVFNQKITQLLLSIEKIDLTILINELN